ncbi:hypothetical protein [Leptospira broomii]|uniref:hypothetical protein n=1 Tax=Leptospira broomii TaxID=301541 RepID=UPI0002898EB7|nr:hypothetical protein [Leptospira broomii]
MINSQKFAALFLFSLLLFSFPLFAEQKIDFHELIVTVPDNWVRVDGDAKKMISIHDLERKNGVVVNRIDHPALFFDISKESYQKTFLEALKEKGISHISEREIVELAGRKAVKYRLSKPDSTETNINFGFFDQDYIYSITISSVEKNPEDNLAIKSVLSKLHFKEGHGYYWFPSATRLANFIFDGFGLLLLFGLIYFIRKVIMKVKKSK